MDVGDTLGVKLRIADIEIKAVFGKQLRQVVGVAVNKELRLALGYNLSKFNKIIKNERDEDYILKVIAALDLIANSGYLVGGESVFKLEHGGLAVSLAGVYIFGEGRDMQIRPPIFVVDVAKRQLAKSLKGRFLDLEVIYSHSAGGIVVDDDEFAVDGLMNVGLYAEIAAVAGCPRR